MPEPTPALFERVPRGFFGPLGDLYAELYWELLAELYRHEFEREPFAVVRSTALDVAEAVIRGSRLWIERRQDLEALASQDTAPPREIQGVRGVRVRFGPEGSASVPTFDPQVIDETAAIRALARRLVARLEDSGWMHFQYRAGVGEIMSFHAYAARILQTLLDVARDEQPVFQGLVHSIAALLEPKAFAQRPGVSLSEARRHTLELSRELKILERNIHLFIQRVRGYADQLARSGGARTRSRPGRNAPSAGPRRPGEGSAVARKADEASRDAEGALRPQGVFGARADARRAGRPATRGRAGT